MPTNETAMRAWSYYLSMHAWDMLVHDASIGMRSLKSVSVEDRPVCFQVTACNQFSFHSRSGGRKSYDGLSS